MKRLIFLILLLIVSSEEFNSQIIQNYGFKEGYVSSSQNISDFGYTTFRKSGLSISGFIDLFNFNDFSLSPEIKYIQKGVGNEFAVTGPNSPSIVGIRSEYLSVNYFSVLLSLSYYMNLNAGAPFIKLAPRYDFLLSSDNDFLIEPIDHNEYKNVFGGTVSIGFIPNLSLSFNPFIEISYHMDFSDSYSQLNSKIKNDALEFSIGILFN